MEGTPFGRYRLLELLGRGGMGEVWRAHDTETRRTVAVKLLPANFADDSLFEERFRREAFAVARLNEPHVVPIHAFGEIDGRLYVDMRLIEGRNLGQVLADGPLAPVRAVAIVGQIASALTAAHRAGLVHRDVKPSNILIGDDDFAYLIDFGIVRAADETALTHSGMALGTPDYMAPESLGNQFGEADHRVDVYALACLLYRCLTGERPFNATGFAQIAAAHLWTPPPRPSTRRAGVPAAMDDVIAKGMAKDPRTRFQTPGELAIAARAALSTPDPNLQSTMPAQHLRQYAQAPVPRQPQWMDPSPPRRTPRGGLFIGVAVGVVAIVAAVSIAVVMTQTSAAPGGNAQRSPTASSSAAPVDAAKLVTEAAVNMRDLKSAHIAMSTTETIPGMTASRVDGDVTTNPQAASAGTMDLMLMGTTLTDVDYVIVDGIYYGALTPGQWTDLGPAAETFDPTTFLSSTVGLANLLDGFSDGRLGAEEPVDGLPTQRVNGNFSAAAVNALFPAVKATAPVPGSAWIDPKRERLVQIELQPTADSSIRVTLSDWGKSVTVTKPPV